MPQFYIPQNVIQGDVDEFMKRPGNETAEAVLKNLEEQHQKYKFMEYNLVTKKNRYVHVFHNLFRNLGKIYHMLW